MVVYMLQATSNLQVTSLLALKFLNVTTWIREKKSWYRWKLLVYIIYHIHHELHHIYEILKFSKFKNIEYFLYSVIILIMIFLHIWFKCCWWAVILLNTCTANWNLHVWNLYFFVFRHTVAISLFKKKEKKGKKSKAYLPTLFFSDLKQEYGKPLWNLFPIYWYQ